MKIGLIAGAGDLPHSVINGARAKGHTLSVIAITGFSKLEDFSELEGPCLEVTEYDPVTELGNIIKHLKQSACTHVCFAGYVKRPDLKKLEPGLKSNLYLPAIIDSAGEGDRALLDYILSLFEASGFSIISPQDLCQNLLLTEGYLGSVKMYARHKTDGQKACEIASAIGLLDIGQCAVVCRGLILAVEAQEGTDAMLERVRTLPDALLGTETEREGVLAKIVKPNQDTRVDLPTIGVKTIQLADQAGLAGIIAQSDGAFVIDKLATIKAANSAGIFIMGLPSDQSFSSSLAAFVD